MIGVTTLLFVQYRFFCAQAEDLIALKQQYRQSRQCIDEIKRESEDSFVEDNDEEDDDDDDDYVEDSFIALNRDPEYLKQSTFEYLQTQDLEPLMTTIDVNQWNEYTEQKIAPISTPATMHAIVAPQKKPKQPAKPIKDCGLSWPIDKDKFWLSSAYGPRKRINGTWGFHHGIDMAAVKGTVVKAARAGKVVEAHFQAGFGNTVVIQHSPVIKTRYAHLNAIRVRTGQMVKLGMIIGTVGDTGFIRKKGKDGSHLHFEVYENGKRINPLHCLPRG